MTRHLRVVVRARELERRPRMTIASCVLPSGVRIVIDGPAELGDNDRVALAIQLRQIARDLGPT